MSARHSAFGELDARRPDPAGRHDAAPARLAPKRSGRVSCARRQIALQADDLRANGIFDLIDGLIRLGRAHFGGTQLVLGIGKLAFGGDEARLGPRQLALRFLQSRTQAHQRILGVNAGRLGVADTDLGALELFDRSFRQRPGARFRLDRPLLDAPDHAGRLGNEIERGGWATARRSGVGGEVHDVLSVVARGRPRELISHVFPEPVHRLPRIRKKVAKPLTAEILLQQW